MQNSSVYETALLWSFEVGMAEGAFEDNSAALIAETACLLVRFNEHCIEPYLTKI